MFDLDMNVISKNEFGLEQGSTTCGLLYRSKEIIAPLTEAVRFHGMGALQSSQYDAEVLSDTIDGVRYPLLFIEVGEALEQEAERWRYLLAHDVRVVLIGEEDSIRAMRAVESLGFYYLLWPADSYMIGGMLGTIREDQLHNRGPHQLRSAMRTAVVGLKGGCGCTLIATELAHVIAADSGKQIILVDHNYHTHGQQSGMSVMLGRQSLDRQRLNDPATGHNALSRVIDQMSAQNQLFRLDSLISYLGVEADWGNGEELREYNNQLLDSLSREANFIIEDYSASVDFSLDSGWLCELMDCVVVVVESSLSALLQTRQFLEQLHSKNNAQSHPARIILVLNHVRPDSALDKHSIEQYLRYPVAIELPWLKKCEERLSSNRRFYNGATSLANPFFNLGQVILGKPKRTPSLFQRLKALW